MKNQTPTPGHGVPDAFLNKFGQHLTGILCGFDRLRFRGTLWMLFNPAVMEIYLLRCGVLLKHFKTFAQNLTERVLATDTPATSEQITRLDQTPLLLRQRYGVPLRSVCRTRRAGSGC